MIELQLVEIDRDEAARQIARAVCSFDDIAAAYHFGSSLARCRPDSDIDVALMPTGSLAKDELLQLRRTSQLLDVFETFGTHPVQYTFLKASRYVFGIHALQEARLVYCRDHDVLGDFLEDISRHARENYTRYLSALEEVLTP